MEIDCVDSKLLNSWGLPFLNPHSGGKFHNEPIFKKVECFFKCSLLLCHQTIIIAQNMPDKM